MTTFNNPFQQVYFSDGEAIDAADFNDVQKFRDAQLNDGLLRFLSGQTAAGTGPDFELMAGVTLDANMLFVLNGGNGCIEAKNTPDMNVVTGPGTVLQQLDNTIAGADAELLAFTFKAYNTVGPFAAADATNPRNDLVQVKLEYILDPTTTRHFEDAVTRVKSSASFAVKRRVQATVSIKTGTPAATPTIPTPDAGYVPWAVVRVRAASTSILQTDIHPFQMPLRVECHNIHPYQIGVPDAYTNETPSGSSTWIPGGGGNIVLACAAAGSGGSCYVYPPVGWQAKRLVGVGILGSLPGSSTVKVVQATYGTASGWPDLKDLTSDFSAVFGAGTRYHQTQLLADANGYPIWTNGIGPQDAPMFRIGRTLQAGSHDANLKWPAIKITSAANTGVIYLVRMYLAG